ncbi:MAG: hypothetical protein J6M05_01565 [Cardiobacteriaceae bacterium]|nr:hypothetical protein [Cardiobacteriaceae bacterium]
MYSSKNLITYAQEKFGCKDVSNIIMCEAIKLLVGECIEDFLPQNLTPETFFNKSYIYFCKVNYPSSHFVVFENGEYSLTAIGDRGDNYSVLKTIKSKYLDDILFDLFWVIADNIVYRANPAKYNLLDEQILNNRFQLFRFLLKKAKIY